jgi:hypothetical protein
LRQIFLRRHISKERCAKLRGCAACSDYDGQAGDGRAAETYRIKLRHAGADPRNELRQQNDFPDDEIEGLKKRLTRMDARSSYRFLSDEISESDYRRLVAD